MRLEKEKEKGREEEGRTNSFRDISVAFDEMFRCVKKRLYVFFCVVGKLDSSVV